MSIYSSNLTKYEKLNPQIRKTHFSKASGTSFTVVSDATYCSNSKSQQIYITQSFRTEKDIKDQVKKIRNKKRLEVNTFHSTCLKDSLRSSNFYSFSQNKDSEMITATNSFNPISTINFNNQNFSSFSQTIANKNFFHNYDHPRQPNVSQFIKKTHSLMQMKYALNLQKERVLQIEDEYSNSLEQLEINIQSYKKLGKLFTEDYMIKFDRYVKMILAQKVNETIKLTNIREKRKVLNVDVIKLEMQKEKLKSQIMLGMEYRQFFICLKERRRVDVLNFDELNETNRTEKPQLSLTKSNDVRNLTNRNIKKISISYPLKKSNKNLKFFSALIMKQLNSFPHEKSTISSKQSRSPENDNIDLIIKNRYPTVQHVLDDFMEFETTIVHKLKIFSENAELIKKLTDINKKYDNNFKLQNEIKFLEQDLKQKKLQNVDLHEKIKHIKIAIENNKTQNNLCDRVVEIYDNLSPIISKIPINRECLYNNKFISTLITIEKGLEYLNDRIEFYKNDKYYCEIYNNKLKELERERKSNMIRLQELANEIKKEKLKKNINEKYARIHITKGRKIASRFKPFKKRGNVNSKNITEDNMSTDFQDLISFN